ncbi:prohibitin family protein [Paraburkholderia kururiensis]|jgi:regulator of protease activity HflC (stomatin/prohibitin superfamily)|uniref:Prohibitin family protein n=1 Tax=Paraburkholderia kururiensis TaxID=984307 RepID=A0ABZ0WMK4_9BURK|nr:prohibitin family protein [Paraburkholderia kururiensis]WQD78598.1 prohibitin family protein [Paraburkholderia kururiensis]
MVQTPSDAVDRFIPRSKLKFVLSGIVVAVIAIWLWPFRTVPTGSRGVVTQFGAIKGIENEGLVVLPPWQHLTLFSVRAEEAQIENADGSTSDTQPVKVSMTVRYSISVDRVAEVYEKYSHDGNLASYVQTATQEVFKAVTARYTAPDLIAQRAKVSADIASALKDKLALYGAHVINIDMRNFSFSPEYMAAINQKVTQEQLRLAAENKVRTVEAEQKQNIAIAEAEATALRAKADGEAYANLTVAKAQAEALRLQNEALAQNRDVLELRRIEVERAKADKWDGKLPEAIYAGAPIPFLNVQNAKQ